MQQAKDQVNHIFFKGLYKEVWKKLINPALTAAECDFINEVANLHSGARVLDLMCGFGRHALALARAGCDVTAVDNLREYIDELQQTAQSEHLQVHSVADDVLAYTPEGAFDAVICMGNSFAFFSEEDVLGLLHKISSVLKADGTFVISTWMIAEIAFKHFRERDWMQVDEFKYLLDNTFEYAPSRIVTEHTVIRNDGATEVIKGVDYIFSLNELEKLFNQAGLTTTTVYSTPRKRPFRLGDGTAYIVVKKQ